MIDRSPMLSFDRHRRQAAWQAAGAILQKQDLAVAADSVRPMMAIAEGRQLLDS